ncbi:MAG: chromosome segregation protein SMC [Bacteroidota bacterium]
MYLKRLALHGFKSFAQKTTVDFSEGVTAIVGPNGCGKSNVVDSIRWVLGEQRARLLRSENMAGVIFNGAAGKKALGMAEVQLTIENTHGVLPTEYGEVQIARRLYRSGDSEYLLNGTTCRLRDILDLFMDTGMGAGAYSVIELKMIEDILSDNAADRRRMFEEAAGVTKYKARRGQALRKLDATQADLTRLDDILEEVEKRVRSLSRQAQKAARHRRFTDRLRALELAMIAHDHARLAEARREAQREMQEARDEAEKFGAQVATGEAALEEERTALVAREEAMGTRRRQLDAHIEEVRALEAEIRVGAERRAADARALDRLAAEDEADRARLGTLASEAETLAARQTEASEALTAAAASRDDAAEAGKAAQEDAQRARVSRDDARRTHAQAQQATQNARRALDRLGDRRALRDAERARLEQERQSLEATDAGPAAPDLAPLESAHAQADQQFAAARTARDARQSDLEAAEAAVQTARAAREAARAEASLLAALQEEGVGDVAIEFLREHPDWNAPTVADVIGCAEADRLAVEAALGPWANCLVVATEAEADAAIGRLRASDKGRATFLVLDRLGRAPQERSPTPPGVTPLADRVRVAMNAFEPLVPFLFPNTFLAPSLAEARAKRESYPVARFVTREGAWTDGSGAVHGGSAQAQVSRLGTQERLTKAEQDLEITSAALVGAEAEREQARVDRDAARVAVQRAEQAREAARAALADARRQSDRIQAQREAADAQAARLGARLEALAREAAGEPDESELQAAVNDLLREETEAEAALQSAEAAATAADSVLQVAQRTWSDARLAHARAQAEADAARTAVERADAAREEISARQTTRAEERTRLEQSLAEASGVDTEAQAGLDTLRQDTDALRQRAEAAETEVLQARARISDAEAALREVRSYREKAADRAASADLRRTESATRLDALDERLAEEHGVTLDEADHHLEKLQAEELFQPDTARLEIPRLRDKVRGLGAVNELALEQYDEEKERLGFLQEQREDLASAEATLLETIDEINTTAAQRFGETFEAVRAAFSDLFTDLFGADAAADLSLEGEDPLEAPVEIRARPSGKRPVSLGQLSGGEKTLTAIALLFAIYLVKPSPFCILDEVDAPLDDANIGRFMHLIRRFADRTQFILVTHNKLTMEAADRMYGVTMPTPGVSRLVGVRFDEASGDGADEPVAPAASAS